MFRHISQQPAPRMVIVRLFPLRNTHRITLVFLKTELNIKMGGFQYNEFHVEFNENGRVSVSGRTDKRTNTFNLLLQF